MRRLGPWGVAAAALLLGSACISSFAKDNPQLCDANKGQAVKDAVAGGLTPQAAADEVGTDLRCLSDDEAKQVRATYVAFTSSVTSAPAPTLASPAASPTTNAASTQQPTAAPTDAPATQTPATRAPTAAPTPSPTPFPSPSLAAGDAGWPPKSISPIQSNEAPITGRVVHANGTGAGHHCLILTSGPCAATTDANGSFTLKFASGFGAVPINIVVKGQYNSATGDGPVVGSQSITMSATGVSGLTITVP